MAREKQHVFSARTTEEGLRSLNELKNQLKVSWDELVIEAVSARHGLDKAMMSLPRKGKSSKEALTAEQEALAETTGEAHPVEKKTKKKLKKG